MKMTAIFAYFYSIWKKMNLNKIQTHSFPSFPLLKKRARRANFLQVLQSFYRTKLDFAFFLSSDCCLEVLVVNGGWIVDDVVEAVVVVTELKVAHLCIIKA